MRVILIICFSFVFFGQSWYRIGGKVVNGGIKVERVITVNSRLERQIAVELLGSEQMRARYIQGVTIPSEVVGPNMYLRGIGNRFRKEEGWKDLWRSDGYNGAHHIVTRSVIQNIAGKRQLIVSNAPSVFHPLHNRPEYADVFHNHKRQLELYEKCGIKCVIEDFFERIEKVNNSENMLKYSEQSKKKIMLEAQLWAKHWGLKWD